MLCGRPQGAAPAAQGGIRQDLAALGILTNEEVAATLRRYLSRTGYLRAYDATRYDLNGEPTGEAEARRAEGAHAQLQVRRKEIRLAKEAAERPPRLGFADLKKAA